MARFVNAPKHVNQNYAIDLIAEVPPKAVKERVVYCDGGDDKTGHPRVYINLVNNFVVLFTVLFKANFIIWNLFLGQTWKSYLRLLWIAIYQSWSSLNSFNKCVEYFVNNFDLLKVIINQ